MRTSHSLLMGSGALPQDAIVSEHAVIVRRFFRNLPSKALVRHYTVAIHPENIDARGRTAKSRERLCNSLSNRVVFRRRNRQLRALDKIARGFGTRPRSIATRGRSS